MAGDGRVEPASPQRREEVPAPTPPAAGQPAPPGVTTGRGRRVPLAAFVIACTAAVATSVLWMTTRSELDEARAELEAIEEAEASLPDLAEVGRRHLGTTGAIEDSSAEHLSATIVGARGLDGLEDLLEELGFSPAVIERIGNTRALDGTQSAEAPHVVATWTYHPDDGLSIVFERTEH